MRDMMSVLLEGALDEELDEELGYSKYDYRNKETDNSRNGHSSKTMQDVYKRQPYGMTNDYMFRLILEKNNYVLKGLICSLLSLTHI